MCSGLLVPPVDAGIKMLKHRKGYGRGVEGQTQGGAPLTQGRAREFATRSVLLLLVPSSERGLAMAPHVHPKRAPGFSLVPLSPPFGGQCIPNRPPQLGFLLFLSPVDPKQVPKILPRCLISLSHPLLSPGRLLQDDFLCTMFERSLQATAIWKSSYYRISNSQELFFPCPLESRKTSERYEISYKALTNAFNTIALCACIFILEKKNNNKPEACCTSFYDLLEFLRFKTP